MSKKTFSAAPKPKKPSDDEIAAFEQGGSGHDRAKQSDSAISEPYKRLSVDLPESMHTRFKTACSATGRKMAVELKYYIEQRTQELETEADIPRK